MGRPSAWSRQKEVVEDDTAKKIEAPADEEKDDSHPTTKTMEAKTNGTSKAIEAPKTLSEKTKDADDDEIVDAMKSEKEEEHGNGIEDTAVVDTKDVGAQFFPGGQNAN